MTNAPTLDHLARAPASASRAPATVRKARVVLLQTQAEAAGAQEVSRVLGEGLAARGYDIHHVFLFRRTAAFDRQPNTFFCTTERPTGIWSLVQLLVALVRHLRGMRPAALICFQHYGNLVGTLAGRLAGIDAIVTNRTTARSLVPWWVERLDRTLGALGLFDRTVVTKTVEEEYRDFPPGYRARIVRIDHGLASKSTDLSRDAARSQLGLPANTTLVGSVARLHPGKNWRLPSACCRSIAVGILPSRGKAPNGSVWPISPSRWALPSAFTSWASLRPARSPSSCGHSTYSYSRPWPKCSRSP